ncbi:MAG: ABC transporter permease, partial [Muribaculaceae bacterium]|nr:ABC transporter permease [Muribaculaceae bacterium]
MMFVLYMFLLMYGAMVMNSIIEEKNNRVLEIVVSSVSPTQLMMGKIMGVGLVAVTQVLIWLVLIAAMSGLLLPAIVPAEMMQEASALNSGTLDPAMATLDMDLAGALGILSNVGYLVSIFTYLLLFLIGGFLFYAAIFAAIGSAVDNIQDASQLQTVAVVPVLIGLIGSMVVVNDPNSVLAVVLSLVPFTSSMVMMTRIPFGIASWEIVLSLVLLYASFIGMVWIAAKIYRVGIFMYGKKPTLRDLIRWARYK